MMEQKTLSIEQAEALTSALCLVTVLQGFMTRLAEAEMVDGSTEAVRTLQLCRDLLTKAVG